MLSALAICFHATGCVIGHIRARATLSILCLAATALPAHAADVNVGLLRKHKSLASGVAAAKAGDRIFLDAGIYLDDSATINVPLTIEGNGAILRITKPLANRKGILVVNADLTVHRVTFEGAEVTDADGKNGAGIRHQTGNLTVEASSFVGNQNGILANPGDRNTVTITRSFFTGNGAGDGYTHGIYINAVARLIVSDSVFSGTRVGHDIKSRALITIVRDTVLDDGISGTPSYAIDMPNGGEAVIENVRITQGPRTSNNTMIAFGAEGKLHARSSLTVRGSAFINSASNATGINNFTTEAVTLIDNTFQGVGTRLRGAGETSQTVGILRQADVFSGRDGATQSFLRLHNTGSETGAVHVALYDGVSGARLTQWTSPPIPPNASPQFAIAAMEAAAQKPAQYTLVITSTMKGDVQHVLFRGTDGTLTNASTCETGVGRAHGSVANVHALRLGDGFPSTVVIHNSGPTAARAQLAVYDSSTGARLGTYATAPIPPEGQVNLTAPILEARIGETGAYHYTMAIENDFIGTLQHLVSNERAGVTTDMTTVCALRNETPATTTANTRMSAVFAAADGAAQSYLRFYNAGPQPGYSRVALFDASGTEVGQWRTPDVPPGASWQYSMAEVERSAAAAPGALYSVAIEPFMRGSVQHVLFRRADGTLTNLSTCESGTTITAQNLMNVHSSLFNDDYPSTVVVYNTGDSAVGATLTVRDARSGGALGSFTTQTIPSNGQLTLPVAEIESAADIGAADGPYYHYNISAAGFGGVIQHRVHNMRAGVTTDMTTVCALEAR